MLLYTVISVGCSSTAGGGNNNLLEIINVVVKRRTVLKSQKLMGKDLPMGLSLLHLPSDFQTYHDFSLQVCMKGEMKRREKINKCM